MDSSSYKKSTSESSLKSALSTEPKAYSRFTWCFWHSARMASMFSVRIRFIFTSLKDMKRIRHFLPFLLLFTGFFACQPNEERHTGAPGDSTNTPPYYTRFEDCPRGEPKPILNLESFPKRSFSLEPDSGWAREATVLRRADSLVILHSGCEYPATSFRLYLPMPDTAGSPWKLYRKAMPLLHQVLDGMAQPEPYREGFQMLTRQIAQGKLRLGEKYEFGVLEPGGIIHTVAVQEVAPLPDGQIRIVVEFGQGPVKE